MNIKMFLMVFGLLALLSADALASGLAGDAGVQRVMESISGPTATAIGIIAIVAGAIMAAFNADNMSGSMKLFIGIAFVVGIALNAGNLIRVFGSGSNGALI